MAYTDAADVRRKAESLEKPSEEKKLEEQARERLADARAQKAMSKQDIEQAYFFAAPRRARMAATESQTQARTRPEDADELQTSIGYEVTEDFMTMIIKSFMPKEGQWAERRPDPSMPLQIRKQVERAVKEEDKKIFQMISGCNFHGEMAKQGIPDGAIGVFAMTVKDPGQGRPVQCLGVPIRELEINLGPDGRIDDRFVVRSTLYRKLPALLRGIKLPDAIQREIRDNGKKLCTVTWGYWRDWEAEDEVWQHVVLVKDKVVHSAKVSGQGACELVIGRFGASPDFAWPDGPMIKALPDLRQHDEMRKAWIENIDFTLRPPIKYPDDGVMNFDDGIQPGMAYPSRPGGGPNDLQKIYEANPLDAAMFEDQEVRRRVKRLHYVDFPEQPGKTPPTATQWLDEMVEAQEKIGTPGYSFWDEFPYEVFQRFRYLGEKRGTVMPIMIEDINMPLQAYNPARRAQDNQEVLTATRLAQIGASMFPQTWQMVVNEHETLVNFKEKMGDEIITLRSPEELAAAAQMLGQLGGVGGAPQGGLQAGAQGGGMPPVQ